MSHGDELVMEQAQGELALTIASKPENITQVECFIEKIQKLLNFRDELYGNILVALTEAVNNAIFHGNQTNESKSVDIQFVEASGNLEFKVADQGPGFDHENLPDPTAPENIEKPTGRGVFLMRSLSDSCEYENNGNTVKLQFKL